MRHLTLFAVLATLLMLTVGAVAVRTVDEPTTTTTNGNGTFDWYPPSSGGHSYNPSVDGPQQLVINTPTTATAYPQNITIVAGEYWRSALGDKLFQLPTNNTYVLGPFESSWFKQYNETVLINSNATRGSIALVQLP